jgi:hypothetical protein
MSYTQYNADTALTTVCDKEGKAIAPPTIPGLQSTVEQNEA